MSVYNIYNDITSYADIFYIYITDFYILYILYKTIYVIYNINILYIYICMYVRNNALARSARAFAFRRREFEVKKKRSTG